MKDRSAGTFARWLREHPGVEVITRGRGGCYALGETEGAPHARKIADCWHLLSNAAVALEYVFLRYHSRIAESIRSTSSAPWITPLSSSLQSTAVQDSESIQVGLTPGTEVSAARRERRQTRYEQIRELHAQGKGVREVARATGLARGTVRRYLSSAGFPERSSRSTPLHLLDRLSSVCKQRWDEGCRNVAQLWREAREQGYEAPTPHSSDTVRGYGTFLLAGCAGVILPRGSDIFLLREPQHG